MIRKLQNQFIRIALVTLTVAMVLVVGVVNVANWISVRGELSDTLDLLVQSFRPKNMQEALPFGIKEGGSDSETQKEEEAQQDTGENENLPQIDWNALPMPPSRHYRNMLEESSWFFAQVTEAGEIEHLRIDRRGNTDEDAAKQIILQAAEDGRNEGLIKDCLYQKTELGNGLTYIFVLNCETRISSVRKLVLISVIACAGAILLSGLLVKLASRRAVEPTIRNMEQQKQFITNASHELKTPLTVIATNMELLQMESGNNRWVLSTQKQTAQLRRLVDELVYLSRMEEEHPTLEMEAFDPAEMLKETAEPFTAMAEFNGREMTVTAEEGLQITGDKASIQRLMSILCDNALKYADDGTITAEIFGEGKNVVLRVSNPVSEPLSREQCQALFNRFYRADPSRSKEKKSGFGIGLAIAAAIVEKHAGKISAAMEGERLVLTCQLPKAAK